MHCTGGDTGEPALWKEAVSICKVIRMVGGGIDTASRTMMLAWPLLGELVTNRGKDIRVDLAAYRD